MSHIISFKGFKQIERVPVDTSIELIDLKLLDFE